jgi:hypothetical protein
VYTVRRGDGSGRGRLREVPNRAGTSEAGDYRSRSRGDFWVVTKGALLMTASFAF